MPKAVQITTPSSQTQDLVERIGRIEGIIGMRLIRAGSLKPPGDLISLEVTDRSLHELMRLLDERGVGRNSDTSIVTSNPSSVISSPHKEQISNDMTEQTWEEVEWEMGRESNMTPNGLATMCVSGVVAVVGVTTGAVHLVIGAMVIAPGFEPLTRISFGLVAGSPAWRRGLRHTATGYAALLLAAMATALLLRAAGYETLGGESTYHTSDALVTYWTTVTFPGVAATVAAAAGGAVLIAAGRAILTGGVMIALALIPTMAILGMALVAGDRGLSGAAAIRWLIDAASVVLLSALVLGWKRVSIHRRKAMS